MLDFAALEWIPILIVTVAGFVLGGLWYGPLFGKAWLAAIGKTEEEIQPSPKPFIVSFFSSLATAIGIALIANAAGVTTAADGAVLGAIVGVGFITAGMASDYAFCGWGDKLLMIQSGYRITYSIMMGVVLASW